ncbi:hypothetical protein DBR17_03125, partial [Sphingomonas sp. HMWF008]
MGRFGLQPHFLLVELQHLHRLIEGQRRHRRGIVVAPRIVAVAVCECRFHHRRLDPFIAHFQR